MSEALRMMQYDCNHSLTPDLWLLRKNRYHHVFLWDSSQTTENLATLGDDVFVWCDKARTEKKYVPWYSPTNETDHEAYMLDDPFDILYMEDQGGELDGEPRPVGGSIIQLDHHGIVALDEYYFNQEVFTRTRIKAIDEDGDVFNCYCYMNKLDQIADYDTYRREYVLLNPSRLKVFDKGSDGVYFI